MGYEMLEGDKITDISFERSAWHEAGHAALLLLFRRPIYDVWITDEVADVLGEVNYLRYDFLPYVEKYREELEAIWPEVVMLCWQEMAVAYAGVTAEEYVFGGDADTLFNRSCDEGWLLRQLLAVHNSKVGLGFERYGMNVYWPDLRAEVRALLCQPDNWRVVTALADALLQRSYLTGAELVAVVEKEFTPARQLPLFTVDDYLPPFPQ